MANELVHATVGTSLSQLEFEAVGLHVLNSQATGDLIYASSISQLTRLAKGAANTVLVMGASIPAWSATLAGLTLTSPTINGTIATTGLTLPAITLGGALTLNGQVFDASAGSFQINGTTGIDGALLKIKGTDVTSGPALEFLYDDTTPDTQPLGGLNFRGYDGAGVPALQRYAAFRLNITNITDTTEEATFYWYMMAAGAVDNLAMTLSGAGALWLDLSVDSLTYKVSGTQVVGARVIDGRADDVVDATYGAEEAGVLDALRDAMITHGLIAAA